MVPSGMTCRVGWRPGVLSDLQQFLLWLKKSSSKNIALLHKQSQFTVMDASEFLEFFFSPRKAAVGETVFSDDPNVLN